MNDIDKVIEALRRSFLFQINCELTDVQSKMLLDRIAELEERNEVLEDSCEILRMQNDRLYEQVFSDNKPDLPEEVQE